MRSFIIFVLLSLSSLLNAITYEAKLETGRSPCMRLTSDKETLITHMMGRVDIWRAENLSLLKSFHSVPKINHCYLSQDDKFFFFNSSQNIYIYDLQKMKLNKKLKVSPKTLFFSMSLSKEGTYVNTIENRRSSEGDNHKEIYRYNIKTGKATRVLKMKIRSATYLLHEDTMYAYDDVQKRAYAFDILSKQRKDVDVKVFDSYKPAPRDTRCISKGTSNAGCIVDGTIVYEFDAGVVRRDLNASSAEEIVVTYKKSKPLKTERYFELGVNGDIVIEKGFNIYSTWDIKKGRKNWVNDLKLQMSVEGGDATLGIAFFHHKNHVLITPPFGGVFGEAGKRRGGIMDFDLNDGSFTNLDVAHTGSIGLSPDDKVLAIRNHDKKIYFYETKRYKLLDKSGFKRLKKQVNTSEKMLIPFDPEPWRRRFYEIEDEKYNYTVHKDGMVVKSEIYSGIVVAQKRLAKRNIKLKLFDNGRKILVSARDGFVIYRTDNLKELAKFYSFKTGEWLVMTPEGYFNASSQAVLPNIFKMEKMKETLPNKKRLLEQKFRPDIVSALLQEQNIRGLKQKKNTYNLLMYNHENKNSLDIFYAKIKRERDYTALIKEVIKRDIKSLNLVIEMIEDANNKKEYRYAYKVLARFPFAMQKTFIEKKTHLNKLTKIEQKALVYALFKNKDREARDFAVLLLEDTTVSDTLKKMIRKKMRRKKISALRSLAPEEYSKNSALLWEVFENNEGLNEAVLLYLHKSDATRYEKHLTNNIISLYSAIEVEKDKDVLRVLYYKLEKNFSQLTVIKTQVDIKNLSYIATEVIQKHFEGVKVSYKMDVYYQFVSQYGTFKEREKVASHLKKNIDIALADTSYGAVGRFKSSLRAYNLYNHEDTVKLLLTCSSDKFIRGYYYIFGLMGEIKDPVFVPILLKHFEVDEYVLRREALNALLEYDSNVVVEVVKVLNTYKSCSKIPALERVNSTIEMKLNVQQFQLYRCGNE